MKIKSCSYPKKLQVPGLAGLQATLLQFLHRKRITRPTQSLQLYPPVTRVTSTYCSSKIKNVGSLFQQFWTLLPIYSGDSVNKFLFQNSFLQSSSGKEGQVLCFQFTSSGLHQVYGCLPPSKQIPCKVRCSRGCDTALLSLVPGVKVWLNPPCRDCGNRV